MTSDSRAEIKNRVREYIVQEFLYGEEPDELDDTTQLISGGILDSIATVKLVSYIEDTYDVRLKPHEMTATHLETLDKIADLVESKRSKDGREA